MDGRCDACCSSSGAVVLVDTMFFSAITPLLPTYAERFDLSKAGAGILAGSYAAGTVLGTLPSGWLATRAGSRRTLLLGLALMAVSSVGFAFAGSVRAARRDALRRGHRRRLRLGRRDGLAAVA